LLSGVRSHTSTCIRRTWNATVHWTRPDPSAGLSACRPAGSSSQADVPTAAPHFRRRMPLYPRPRHGANPRHPSVMAVERDLSDRATPTEDAGSRWRARDTQVVREDIRGRWNSSAAFPLLWSSPRITCGESFRCTFLRHGLAAVGNLSSRCRASRPARWEGRSARVGDELLGRPCPRWNRVLWGRRCSNPLRTPPSGKGQVAEDWVGATEKAGQSSPAFRIPWPSSC
jgi:hypothetical protein